MAALYLLQTFKNSAQIERLVKTLRRADPECSVIISHHREHFALDAAAFADFGQVFVLNVTGVNRVDFSLTASYLEALEYAEKLDIAYDWVVNLTGQCYPIRPLSEFAKLLDVANVDGFVDHETVFGDNPGGIWPYDEAHGRYHFQYRWRITRSELPPALRYVVAPIRAVVNRVQERIRIDTGYALQVAVRDRSTLIDHVGPLYGGSFFMTLSRRSARYLCSFARAHPDVVAHFGGLNIPSEVFPHTVLLNNPAMHFSDMHHFFYDNDDIKRGRPRVLTASHWDRMVSSEAFFARKFDLASDRELLDRVDRELLGLVLTR